jgi:hypothetical protein
MLIIHTPRCADLLEKHHSIVRNQTDRESLMETFLMALKVLFSPEGDPLDGMDPLKASFLGRHGPLEGMDPLDGIPRLCPL